MAIPCPLLPCPPVPHPLVPASSPTFLCLPSPCPSVPAPSPSLPVPSRALTPAGHRWHRQSRGQGAPGLCLTLSLPGGKGLHSLVFVRAECPWRTEGLAVRAGGVPRAGWHGSGKGMPGVLPRGCREASGIPSLLPVLNCLTAGARWGWGPWEQLVTCAKWHHGGAGRGQKSLSSLFLLLSPSKLFVQHLPGLSPHAQGAVG